jgi:hypothetical protein
MQTKGTFFVGAVVLGSVALVMTVMSTATGSTVASVDRQLPASPWQATATVVHRPGIAAAVPPLTCNGNIDGQVTATYAGTTLSATRTDYTAKMSCTSGPHGETMTALRETPLIRINGEDVHEGPTGQCGASKAAASCSAVQSKGTYTCTGTAPCAGDYQIGHRSVMVLPAGFEWRDVPAGCRKATPRDLRCVWFGGVVTVRETLPPSPSPSPSSLPTGSPSPSPIA